MSDNTITITLDDVLGPDGLEGAWDGMVAKLTERAESEFLHSDAGKSFHAVAVGAINKAVEGKIAERLEVLISKPIQKTDTYGNPVGEPTSFDAMIGEAVDRALTSHVDLYGKPKPYGSSKGMHDLTLFEYALRRVALEGLDKEVRAAARKVNQDAKAAVAKEVAKAIAATIK